MTGAAGGPHTVSHCCQEFIELRASNSQFMGKGCFGDGRINPNDLSMSLSSIDLFGFVRSFVREPDESVLETSVWKNQFVPVVFHFFPTSIADPERAIQVASHFDINRPLSVGMSSTFS